MVVRSRRAQALLTPDEYELLEEHAAATGKSVSQLIRETVERHLIAELQKERRLRALERLFSQNLPVEDWPEMKRQIIEGRYRGHGEPPDEVLLGA